MATLPRSRRLAGIRFEHRAPEPPERLPRMDVALFVGFASAGPLHTPVPIETIARFEDVFGPDPRLARDPTTGLTRLGYLGATVRGFFANGGRRCWVVRVADEARAERSRIPIGGLLRVNANAELSPAFGFARSAGSFFDGVGLRASLATRGLVLHRYEITSAGAALTFEGAGVRDVAPGDLVRLVAADPAGEAWLGFIPLEETLEQREHRITLRGGASKWFRRVSEPRPSASGAVRVIRYDATEVTSGATLPSIECSGWIETWPVIDPAARQPRLVLSLPTGAESPPVQGGGQSDLRLPIGQWLKIRHPDGTMWMVVRNAEAACDERAGSSLRIEGDAWWEEMEPDAALLLEEGHWRAELVSLDLQARHAAGAGREELDRDPRTLTGLGLTPDHPRSWNKLSSDEGHFAELQGPLSEEERAFASEVDAPRFALAGNPAAAASWFVPLGLDTLGSTTLASYSRDERLVRDGLEVFSPEPFLDPALSASGVDALAGDADFLRFGLGGKASARQLRGLHAGFTLDEVSIVAVPDALHAAWQRSPRSSLPTPIPSPLLERPKLEFADCRRSVPVAPALEEIVTAPDGTMKLVWQHGGERGVTFILQESRLRDFSDARTIWYGGVRAGSVQVEHTIRDRTPGTYYYRVAAVAPLEPDASCTRGLAKAAFEFWERYFTVDPSERAKAGECALTAFEFSDWSNGRGVAVEAPPDWEEALARDYDPSTWLAVSRAAVRFCGARSNAIVLLALPGHARSDEALKYQNELVSPSGSGGGRVANDRLGVREASAWSYAAAYHPWVTSAAEAEPPRSVPPLGAVAGLLAARALERGAWVAPANQPLAGVLGLGPDIPSERHQEFLERQVNLLRQEPSGFLVLSQDTLASDPESADAPLRPLNVRRLLILLRRLVLRVGEPYVFEPNGEDLRVRVRHTFESVFARLQARGAFAGRTGRESYRVECGDDVNPPYAAEAGRLVVEIKVAPSRPLAFLTIRLVQIGDKSRVLELA
jgi:hypothetical protein